MWRHCWAKRLSYGKISATITATEPIRPSWRTFTWVTSILGYGRSPSMVIVGPSVRFELHNPDLSEISVTAQTRGTPLPGTRSIVARRLCPMGTERGTPAVCTVGRIFGGLFPSCWRFGSWAYCPVNRRFMAHFQCCSIAHAGAGSRLDDIAPRWQLEQPN